MKVKEIDRTANITWSPALLDSVYLAAGTTAQQLDATFSTTACLEIYSLDFREPGQGMKLEKSLPTKNRFHKLVWGSHGVASGTKKSGILVGGAEQGNLMIYDAAKIFDDDQVEANCLLAQNSKHTGPVRSLDFNPFQQNLLASGASDSEIFIWDLNSPVTPMTPGAVSQPPDDVMCVAWNQQVQHILASTFAARCVVWDLRKNEPIIKVSDNSSRMRYRVVSWHPDVATQLCLASEEDYAPVIQLWDLRYATSPLRTLQNHQRGILSMAWCAQDPDMLVSCGKDNRTLIWNPNADVPNGEVLCEVATTSQWSFDVSWCPKYPSLIATSSFDGKVGVHSIMGGREVAAAPTMNKIADSFPGMESIPGLQAQQQQQVVVHQQPKKPPRWTYPRCGASFGFGNKLVSFGFDKTAKGRQVEIQQVVTENELVEKSLALETALKSGNLHEFCQNKAAISQDQQTRTTWSFLGANFSQAPRLELLNLLGYDKTEVTEQLAQLSVSRGSSDNLQDDFEAIATEAKTYNIQTDNSVDGQISRSLLNGDIETAVNLCFQDKRFADAIVLSMAGGEELLNRTRDRYFRSCNGDLSNLIRAVVTRNWSHLVQHCDVMNWKEALVAALNYADEEEYIRLCQVLGDRLNGSEASSEALLCYICSGNLDKVVECWQQRQSSRTSDLQELIEQVMVLGKAGERLGRQALNVSSGPLAAELGRYAGLLAGQGKLDTALSYANMLKDPAMNELKERLQHALGLVAVAPSRYPQQQQQQQQRFNYGLANGAAPSPYSKPKQQPQQQQQYYGHPAPPKPATPAPVQDFYNPIQQHYGHQQPTQRPQTPLTYQQPSYVQQPPLAPPPSVAQPPVAPPTVAPVAPPPAAVPPPPAGATVSRVGSLLQRSRVYVQDPSISGGSAGQNYYAQAASATPFSPAAAASFSPPGGSYTAAPTTFFNPAASQQYNPPAAQPFSPVAQFGQPAQQVPQPPAQFYQPEPVVPPRTPPATALNGPAVDKTQSFFTPATNPVAVTPLEPAAPPASAALPPAPPVSAPPPGWNDPPLLTTVSKPAPSVPVVDSPITHPLFGAAPVEQQQQPLYPVSLTPVQHHDGLMPSHLEPATEAVESFGSAAGPAAAAAFAPQPPVAAPLAPLPAEHQVLHDVFHVLKEKCVALTTNAQMKRKLDDVAKKLENLDEKLRNNGLSGNTLLGLHQIVQATQQGDYSTALAIHTQVVSGTNFTEIGSFMPGLKVLLQTSAQLGITVN